MLQTATKIIKWVSIPVLLIASLFACCVPSYELLVDCVMCLGAAVLIQRAIQSQEYFWAGGVVAIAVAFTPFSLVVKIFLLMGITCLAVMVKLFVSFRPQPAPVV
jgi:hypothetical protein